MPGRGTTCPGAGSLARLVHGARPSGDKRGGRRQRRLDRRRPSPLAAGRLAPPLMAKSPPPAPSRRTISPSLRNSPRAPPSPSTTPGASRSISRPRSPCRAAFCPGRFRTSRLSRWPCGTCPASAGPGLGGDWFDVIPLSGARGRSRRRRRGGARHPRCRHHGPAGAPPSIRSPALDLEPDELLSRLDDLVNLLAAEQEAVGERPVGEQVIGATCLYAVYDPVSGRCSLARAGHPPPVVTAPDGIGGSARPARRLTARAWAACRSRPGTSNWPREACSCLYTNGIIGERHIDADDRPAKLCAALTRPAGTLERTSQAVVDALVPSLPSDDVVLLIARTRMPPPENVASWVSAGRSLPSAPPAPGHTPPPS